jgi:hypothetical protein
MGQKSIKGIAVGLLCLSLLGCAWEGSGNATATDIARDEVPPRQSFDARSNDPRCRDSVAGPMGVWGPVLNEEETAIRIAGRYFEANFAGGSPHLCRLQARLDRGVWQIRGVLPADMQGGCVNIDICQFNGRVLRMWGEQ